MCFSGEDQLLAKPIFPILHPTPHPTPKELYINRRTSEDLKLEEEILIKKRKILEDKAPGLFDYLTRLTTEEVSTETASSHSGEQEGDDLKHTILIPTPIKNQSSSLLEKNLSNVVKLDPLKIMGESLSLPHIHPGNDTLNLLGNPFQDSKGFEERQRQLIMFHTTKNSLMMSNVNLQTDHLMKVARQCMENLKSLKAELNDNPRSQLERMELIKEEKKHSGNFDSNPTSIALFNHLFGATNIYKYELVLDCELPAPIFRERNLVIKAKLVDALTHAPVKNHNKVLMQLSLQTWEVPSNPILRNKTGNKAVMGDTEVELKNGEVVFDRIQINEVTSKFIHGHVAMVVIPTKPVNHGTTLSDHDNGDGYIKFDQIKPLMLEKVVVKSKKKKNLNKKKNE